MEKSVKSVQLPRILGVGNIFTKALLRAGIRLGPNTLLTVRGRKSGQPRTTPVAVVEHDSKRYIVSVYGIVDWVRNLRAADGEATLTRGRRSEAITAAELTPEEAAPILRETVTMMAAAPSFLQFLSDYFAVTPTSSLEDYQREALRHPVFQILTRASAHQIAS
jgi:deazaflavin-dependent oxidoreductase (nitroreductase family)